MLTQSLLSLLITRSLDRFIMKLKMTIGNLFFDKKIEYLAYPIFIIDCAGHGMWVLGETVLTKPITDRWGTWISALVPIEDPISREIIAVLGIDYSAAEWIANLWKQMIPDFIIIFFILILFSAVLYIWFQNLHIRNLGKKIALDEALYRIVFEQTPVGIAIVNDKSFLPQSEFGKANINPMFEQILDRTSWELEKLKWTEITHPEDLQEDLEKFGQFINGEIAGYSWKSDSSDQTDQASGQI